jgi:DNA-binding transcriptional MerR regulator
VTSALPARQTVTIGEVLAQLRPDFPDVTISKIRFLEAEGLVEPQRSPSGYRRFSHDDVARLRYVLTVQRDNYLPLRVINGLVTARGTTFDADALLVARTAGELAAYGLEPRHLRIVRSAAEREAGLVEQVVAPMLRQRGVEARGRAEEAAREIARLTTRIHAAILDAALRRIRTR